jgi:hypothetical protein
VVVVGGNRRASGVEKLFHGGRVGRCGGAGSVPRRAAAMYQASAARPGAGCTRMGASLNFRPACHTS